jgi:hypothetical protein
MRAVTPKNLPSLAGPGRYFKDYVREVQRFGHKHFLVCYRDPILMGLGLGGEIADRKVPGHGTAGIETAPCDDLLRSHALTDKVWPLCKDPNGPPGTAVLVGRTTGCDLVFAEYSVSQRHCEFRHTKEGLALFDLDSLNGTLVNEEKIEHNTPRVLADGDRLQIGRLKLVFHTASAFYRRVLEAAEPKDDKGS